MFVTFSDSQEIIDEEFLAPGLTVNREYYVCGNIAPSVSKNSFSKTSISGKRKLFSRPRKHETSYCSINKRVFDKT
jgi:hypothetical protein